ncbi:hypothetical protein [Pseudomonas benzenivorans]|uniref:hypothetical protein n=1 Tax=Pseudomonas benzenivorans TaxID=556533 RepID=UPI00351962F0
MSIAHLLILVCLLLGISPGHAETLTWAQLSLPRAAVPQLEGAGEDFILDAQRLLERELPELTHRHRASSVKRLDRELASGSPVCSMTVLRRSERDEVGYFIGYLPVLPMELVSRAGSLPESTIENGKVSLLKLLGLPLRGGISPTRAYPPELQAPIEAGIARGRIEVLSNPSLNVNLMAMISHRRLDYTFEFPIFTEHYSRIAPLPEPLVSLPIVESQELITSGLYCPRTAWGKAMAVRIDAAARRLAQAPEVLLKLYSTRQRAAYEEQLLDYFRTRAATQYPGTEPLSQ